MRNQLHNRLDKIEAKQPPAGYMPISEIHIHIINPDGTPALNEDGTPRVIVQRVDNSWRKN